MSLGLMVVVVASVPGSMHFPIDLALVGQPVAFVGNSVAPVGLSVALIGDGLALLGCQLELASRAGVRGVAAVSFVGQPLPLVSAAVPLIGGALALFDERLANLGVDFALLGQRFPLISPAMAIAVTTLIATACHATTIPPTR